VRRRVPSPAGAHPCDAARSLGEKDADDEAAEGRALAERWCAACHATGPAQASGGDAAPAFATLAASRDDAALAAWMAAPHPPMPDPGLSRDQIAALLAYMKTLRN